MSVKIFDGSQYFKQERKPWMVDNMIREESIAFLVGKEGTGKSFIALELAYCIAEGKPFFGQDVEKGKVLYMAAERGDLQRDRIEALVRKKDYDPSSVFFCDEQMNLNSREGFDNLSRILEENPLIRFVIIDTLRASFAGDENSSSVAQEVMNTLNSLKKRYQVGFLVLHHVNSFGQARGSSAFIGSAETELYLSASKKKDRQRIYLTTRKQNNGKQWVKYTFDAEEIHFDETYSSLVFHLAESGQSEESPQEVEELENTEQHVMNALSLLGGTAKSMRQLAGIMEDLTGSQPNRASLAKTIKKLEQREMVKTHSQGQNTSISLVK